MHSLKIGFTAVTLMMAGCSTQSDTKGAMAETSKSPQATDAMVSQTGTEQKSTAKTSFTQLLSAGVIDWRADTVTLPLAHGMLKDGRAVWYVLTDASDAAKAKTLGLNFAPSLANAVKAASTRTATIAPADGTWVFNSGGIDFSPQREVVPGTAPNYFPPTVSKPGSVALPGYSPLVTVDGVVYNAPVLAFDHSESELDFCAGKPDLNLVHDKVVKFCPRSKTVTLALTHGFAGNKEIAYLSFDANVALPATLEAATLTPATDDLKDLNVSLPLFAVVNGITGASDANHQGFNSALSGDGSPLNILAGSPAPEAAYSPLWDVRMVVWKDAAVQAGQRKRLTSGPDVTAAAAKGLISGPDNAPLGASGILVNCPVVAYVGT